MIDRIREAYEYRSFLFQLVYQQLDQRYHGSVLGFLWTLLFPLLIFVSFTVIFSVLNNWDMKDFGVYFLSGYLFWNLFSTACSMGAESVVGNAVYVTRVYVPKILLPLASVAVSLVDLGAGLAILVILMLAVGAPISAAMLFLPVSAVIAVVFVAGMSMLCAVANVFLRDFRHLLNSLLFLWFFFCPILWKAQTAPPKARLFLEINPLVPFLNAFQAPVWKGELPGTDSMAVAASIALASLLLGVASFFHAERKLYYYL
jgi:ABC-type polysaccharide/polyol phosphate export permease